jgi:hypothetical protein
MAVRAAAVFPAVVRENRLYCRAVLLEENRTAVNGSLVVYSRPQAKRLFLYPSNP